MKSLILSALLVGLVSAQSLTGLPTCAYSCVGDSIPASCNLDPKCICSATAFIQAVTCCVAKACDEADQEATIKYAATICNPVGVTITQTAATCAATATGAASNSTSTGSMSMTSGSSSAALSSSVSSSAGSVSSSLSSAVSSASSAASTAASAAATSSAGAGQLLAQQGGNVFAAIVAAAALL